MNINSIDDYEKFLNIVYEGYKNKLLEFKKDDIEFYKNNNEIKKLKTKEGHYFYVAKNTKSIVSFVSTSKKLCDTFTIDNFLDKLKGVVDKQIRSYNPIVYKDILESNGLVSDSSDYFLIPSNPSIFSLEDYFDKNKDKDLIWGENGAKAPLNMRANNKIFFYISGKSGVYFYGEVKEVREDRKFIINKIQRLEKTISLDEAKKYGFNYPQNNQNFYNIFTLNYLLLANNLIRVNEVITNKENQNLPLNQILYGPPGTGKTYHTIDKALELLGENLENRDDKKAKFDEYVKNGQIVFTTFHQSYGYEEFVEGIKPIIDNDENSQEVKYDIKDGIFKEFCGKALAVKQNFNFNQIKDDFLIHCREKGLIIYKNREYKFEEPNNLITGNLRIYINYLRDMIEQIGLSYGNLSDAEIEVYIRSKINSGDNIINNYKIILDYFYCKYINFSFIFIIDEINRGNVSKIFGELITLIEPSKRLGEKEELRVRLPYSGEEFGVPNNVYIIGTMNTADRSITSLDTALRRRFEFVEMMPDVSKLSINCEGVNLQELLQAINTRIEYLLDREKTIGHAFFINTKDLDGLKNVFQNKIIPLLQEYFYNDYALIDMVLNKNGMLEKQDINNNYLKNMTEFIENDKIIYKFSDSKKWNEATFKKIYE